MRLSLLTFTAAAALTLSACDSTGIDSPGDLCSVDCTGGGSTGTPPGGGSTGTAPGGGSTGTTPAKTFAPVDPKATYLLAEARTPNATAFLLSDFGLAPGATACFKAVGDFTVNPGRLASATGNPVVTGVFSASSSLSAPSERNRVKDAIDGDWDLTTAPLLATGAPTNIDEDWEATDDCWPVPAGATHVFFSVFDNSYADNADANAGGQPFGVRISRR